MMNNFLPLLPELFLALSGLLLLVVAVFREGHSDVLVSRTIAGTKILFLGAILLLFKNRGPDIALNGVFIANDFTQFIKILLLFGLIASLAIGKKYLEKEQIKRFEYPILVLFAGIGMMLMVSANDFLSLYMGIELQSLPLYVLAAIRREHGRAAEAGLKYFILGALSSGMLLFGISLVYGYAGGTGFDLIAQAVSATEITPPGLIVGLVFILTGIAFKLSAVPFHMWTPDVYEGAPSSVTALFAIVPKLAAMALLIRLVGGPFAETGGWEDIVWILSAASMVLGAFAGIGQNNIKRLLSYSAIGNMGYALVGVAAGAPEMTILYMLLYMIMTAGVFGILLSLRRHNVAVEDIPDLAGLSRHHPYIAYGLGILMFSLAGIPPFAGFFGKILIFEAAVDAGLYKLAVIGVLSSVIAAYYYIRLVKVMFFDEPAGKLDPDTTGLGQRIITFCSLAFVVLFIVNPGLVVDWVAQIGP